MYFVWLGNMLQGIQGKYKWRYTLQNEKATITTEIKDMCKNYFGKNQEIIQNLWL